MLVLTMSEEDGTIFDAIRAGARGYLLKGAEPEEVVRAVTTVAGGRCRLRRRARRPDRRVLRPAPRRTSACRSPSSHRASARCSTWCRPACRTRRSPSRLFLSQKTVRNHVSAVLTKLQAADRAEAIVRGRDAGLGR